MSAAPDGHPYPDHRGSRARTAILRWTVGVAIEHDKYP